MAFARYDAPLGWIEAASAGGLILVQIEKTKAILFLVDQLESCFLRFAAKAYDLRLAIYRMISADGREILE